MGRDEDVVRTVAERVLAHLAECPNAADTAEGIREWWLTPQRAVDLHTVEAALKWLVREGLVERAPSTSGTPVYRRAARKDNGTKGEDNN